MPQPAFSKLLDDLNDVSGRRFEQLCRWFLLNDPIYGGQLKNVWLWDDWPGRWGRDKGIDLIAEDNEGQITRRHGCISLSSIACCEYTPTVLLSECVIRPSRTGGAVRTG